jgi:TonB-dependent SusC/RagA subfamily outer membrane receptor
MNRSFFLSVILSAAASPVFAGDGVNTVQATLKSAMVYRNGAELVHTATARLLQGNNELIIDGVSTVLDPASIRVSCGSNVTVMAVSFSKDYLQPQTASPVVKRLQDSLDILAKESGRLNVLSKADEELLDLLGKNKAIGGAQNGVSAAELTKMMDYYRQQEISLRTELAGYAEKAARINAASGNLENQIDEEEKKNTKTSGRILLQLLSPVAGTYDLTVSYLTMAAHWEPAYDLKVTGVSDPLQLTYKARVVQSSGIDWKKVKLSLSTSLPAQGGNAPVLTAKFLRFAEAVTAAYPAFNANSAENTLADKAPGLVVLGYGTEKKMTIRGNSSIKSPDPLYIVNGTEVSPDDYSRIGPGDIESINVLKGADATNVYGERAAAGVVIITLKKGVGDYLSISDNQLDVVFDIDIPYDIPSNGKEQGVELKEYKLPCNYQYYAAPVADKEAYLLGKMQGWEKLNLLPGEASITVEGTYIGRSFIDPGSTQDTLNLTLGRDKRIVVKREKITDFSSVKFLGSSKKEVFTYRITVRNNKKDKVDMMLKDQYPISTDKDIEVELMESSGASVNKDNGVLTWKVGLAPGESKEFRVSYSVKYPKDKAVNLN